MASAPASFLTDAAGDAVAGAEAIGIPTARDMVTTAVKTALHSRGAVRRGAGLGAESMKILAGRSSVAPDPKDWRFKDSTWHDNPVFRRVMQLYLASASEIEELVGDANLEWRDAERAQFLTLILTTALAPTNTLAGNPPALKRAFETGGLSLLRGVRNFARDVRINGGMPTQVNRSAFVVGKDLAATPGAVVYRDDVCELLQYSPTTPEVHSRPVVLIPPQIGRYYFMDLRPKRSFVEHAVSHGLTVFMISWRNPQAEQRDFDLETYAEAVLRVIDVAREISGSDDVNSLSFCAGGILTSMVLSHLAATNDDRIRTATFGVTLLDFDSPAKLGAFDSNAVLSLARAKSNRDGILTGRSLGIVFSLLRPNDLVWNYWVNNYLMGNDPPTFDILAWNADSTNLPAKLHREFLDIFSRNSVAVPGSIEMLGSPVDLGRVAVETYVTGAISDHLTPWKACYRSTQLFGGESTFILSNAGHIASLVNPPGNPKAHYFSDPPPGDDPDEWLAQATEHAGTWWEHWVGWVSSRSGDTRRAPTRLGSRRHKPVEPAPGSYVRDISPAR